MFSESLKTIILFLTLAALNSVKDRGTKDSGMKKKVLRIRIRVLDHTPFAPWSHNHIHASSSVSLGLSGSLDGCNAKQSKLLLGFHVCQTRAVLGSSVPSRGAANPVHEDYSGLVRAWQIPS